MIDLTPAVEFAMNATGRDTSGNPIKMGRKDAAELEALKLWTCSEFEKLEKPEGLDLLGQGIIRRGQLTLLMGQGGLGKSTFSFGLAVASVRREPHFAGIPLHSPLTCLFFNAEASQWR